MISTFKTWNPQWKEIAVVITDKDMVERNVLKSKLSQIHLQICLYHITRTFSREISIEKLGITSGAKQTVLELLQKIAYATSISDYDTQYNHLLSVMPPHVATYYNDQWHSIRDEWVEGLKKCQ